MLWPKKNEVKIRQQYMKCANRYTHEYEYEIINTVKHIISSCTSYE